MTHSEMAIPKPRGEVVLACVSVAFVVFWVLLAVLALILRVALIASLLWLALVALLLWEAVKERGLRGWLVDLGGAFSLRHFAESVPCDGGAGDIRFGYRIFGRRILYFAVTVARIESVAWHSGQGSSLAGRDMNDWSVALWFDHSDAKKSRDRLKRGYPRPDQDVHVVGPSARKEATARFGLEFVALLRQAGAPLVKGKDDCTFIRCAGKAEPQTGGIQE